MKKKIHLYYAAIFLIMVSMGDSCRCDLPQGKKAPCPVISIEPDLRDYCVFKEGSWWVYEEETSKERDSMHVISSVTELWGCQKYLKDYVTNRQVISTSLHSWTIERLINDAASHNEMTDSDGGVIYYSKSSLDSVSTVSWYPVYYNFLQKFKLGNTEYSNVKFFKRYPSDSTQLVYVHAKSIGIIRRELQNGEKWNLVKYNAIQ